MWYSAIHHITEETVRNGLESALDLLPDWRRIKALSYRFDIDKYTCAKAYLMLKELLHAHYDVDEDVSFGYGAYGKPYLKSYPDIHFNYSHCRKAVLCAVGDAPLGADVEEIQYDEEIMRNEFDLHEREMIENAGCPSVKFAELWTRRESCLKLSGVGLCDDYKAVLADMQSKVVFRTDVYADFGVVSTIATGLENVPAGNCTADTCFMRVR